MINTTSCKQKALVPVKLRGDGQMYKDSQCQEASHSRDLEFAVFCKKTSKDLEKLIRCIYVSEKGNEFIISNTAFSFECNFSACERVIMIKRLVFCDRSCQYGMVDLLLGILVTLCMHWSNDRSLSLIVYDPIPFVRESLENMSWCMWEMLENDLAISFDRIEDVEKRIPLVIKSTRCCFGRSEFESRTEQWELDLSVMQLPSLICSSCISQNYLTSLECLFYRLHTSRFIDFICGIVLRTDALCLNLMYSKSKNMLELKLIEVRPCLQGFGIGTMTIWRLMAACTHLQISTLKIARAYPSSVNLMTKLGGFKNSGNFENYDDYFITLDEMCKKTLAVCGLDRKLKESERYPGYFFIDPSQFPSAEDLNE